jgi:tRNA A58 N-methylase Trm61
LLTSFLNVVSFDVIGKHLDLNATWTLMWTTWFLKPKKRVLTYLPYGDYHNRMLEPLGSKKWCNLQWYYTMHP